MNISSGLKQARIIYGAMAFSLLALTGIAGTAHADDIRLSSDSFSGVTSKASASYLECISDSISYNNQVFVSLNDGRSQLFTGSTDPLKAKGIVEVTETNGVSHFSAYQRDAWQDKGALLNAVQICAYS